MPHDSDHQLAFVTDAADCPADLNQSVESMLGAHWARGMIAARGGCVRRTHENKSTIHRDRAKRIATENQPGTIHYRPLDKLRGSALPCNRMNPPGPPHLDLDVEHRAYLEGIRLFNEGQFFEAHDTWEEIWGQTRDRRREQFYRAIIQGAVTLELLRRSRAVGVRQVFVSCMDLFKGLPNIFMGVDIPAFVANLRHAVQPTLDDLDARHIQIDPSRLFTITLLYNPFTESRNGEAADGT
ncbi:MAG: DUF309 domain-containing protein [Planctomycetota bacterium]